MLHIRKETPADWEAVEALVRRAFYNLYMPGCIEHFLVRRMRSHEDFLPELALVAEEEGRVVGMILYTRSTLTGEDGTVKPALTFGPVAVEPSRQRQGISRALMEHSFRLAAAMGHEAVVIFGSPANYVGRGFRCCRRYGVSLENGTYPAAMLVKELREGALAGRRWVYRDSPVMSVDPAEAAAYDDSLPPMEKKYLPSQEEFYIMSHSFVEEEASV